MKLKPGVRVQGIRPELTLALMAAQPLYAAAGAEMVVTSVVEGRHSRGSLHYAGQALDLRTRDLAPDARRRLRDSLADALGGDFDVVLEADHIHLEYQPKDPLERNGP